MDTQINGADFHWSLLPGERLLWTGCPGTGIIFSAKDALLIPFSLMWGGFAIFWEVTVMRSHAPGLFRIWGIPFVLVGLYVIAGRFLVDAWLRGKMRYAVTSQRVLISRSGILGNLTALGLDRLPDVQLNLKSNGRGTLIFGASYSGLGFGGRNWFGIWSPAFDLTPKFIAIPDAQSVFDCIQRAIRGVT